MSKTITTGMLSGVTVNGIPINTSKPCNSSNYANCSSRTVSYVAMHYTGNSKDTAAANASYYNGSGARQASAHFFVDDSNIYQSVELRDRAWHVGATSYRHASCRNTNSIGIEMCCTAGNYKISETTKENAAQLCAYICKLLGITASTVDTYVLRHWDVTGKDCPAQMVGSGNAEWTAFKSRVKAILNGATVTPLTKTVKVVSDDGSLNVRSGPGTSYSVIGSLATGKTAEVVGISGNWYKIKYGSGYGYISSAYTADVVLTATNTTTTTSKQEDDDMTYYKNLEDIPSYYKNAIQKLVDSGAMAGTGGGELNVSEDLCRIAAVLNNAGILDLTAPTVYKTIDDVPSYYRDAVQKLIDRGAISGTGNGELNLSSDLCRALTILDNAHLLDAVTLSDVENGEVCEEEEQEVHHEG